MKWLSQERRIHALSIFFAALPFAFALIRYAQTGSDLRYLWAALASWPGATLVMVVGKAPSRILKVKVALSAGAFVMATLFALLAAVLLGTTVGPGIWVVASAFGFCCATSWVLHALARPQVL
jgi:hypothetical protein